MQGQKKVFQPLFSPDWPLGSLPIVDSSSDDGSSVAQPVNVSNRSNDLVRKPAREHEQPFNDRQTGPPSPNAARKKRQRKGKHKPDANADTSDSQLEEPRVVEGMEEDEANQDPPTSTSQVAFPDATQALNNIAGLVAQLRPASDPASSVQPHRAAANNSLNAALHSSGDGGTQDQTLSQKWKSLGNAPSALLTALHEGDPAPGVSHDFLSKVFIGLGRIDWADSNAAYCAGVVNNRPIFPKSVENLYNSIQTEGLRAQANPLIVVVRREDLPEDVDWTNLPKIVFNTRTYVGIVAGAHRLQVILRIVREADNLLKVAKEYHELLSTQIPSGTDEGFPKRQRQRTLLELQQHIKRVTERRQLLLDWPVKIYDWRILLSDGPEAKKLRDNLSTNTILPRKKEDVPERYAQLFRLVGLQRNGESNQLKKGEQRFPAFKSEITGKVFSFSSLAKLAHWPRAALHCLLHALGGLEALFTPPEGCDIESDAYWKALLTAPLVKRLEELFDKHRGKLFQTGEYITWRRSHREQYWEDVAEVLTKHFSNTEKKARGEQGVEFIRQLANTVEGRIATLRRDQVADMINPNWMTFSTNADMYRYGDAGSHVVHCMLSRVKEDADPVRVTAYVINALFDPSWLELSTWLCGTGKSDPVSGVMNASAASEGLAPMTKAQETTIKAALMNLKHLTGPASQVNQQGTYQEFVDEIFDRHLARTPEKAAKRIVREISVWWYDWIQCNFVNIHQDWSSPLSDEAIKRMVYSYHRTSSGVDFMTSIGKQPSFLNILCLFRGVPFHINWYETTLGWWPLNFTDMQDDEIRPAILSTDEAMLGELRTHCLTAYDAFEWKLRPTRSAKALASTKDIAPGGNTTAPSVDALDPDAPAWDSDAPPSAPEAGRTDTESARGARASVFQPTASIKQAFQAWQIHDLRVLDQAVESELLEYRRALLRQQLELSWDYLVMTSSATPFATRVPFPGTEHFLCQGLELRWIFQAATETGHTKCTAPHLRATKNGRALIKSDEDYEPSKINKGVLRKTKYAFEEVPIAIEDDAYSWFVCILLYLLIWWKTEERPAAQLTSRLHSDMTKAIGPHRQISIGSEVFDHFRAVWTDFIEETQDLRSGIGSALSEAVANRDNAGHLNHKHPLGADVTAEKEGVQRNIPGSSNRSEHRETGERPLPGSLANPSILSMPQPQPSTSQAPPSHDPDARDSSLTAQPDNPDYRKNACRPPADLGAQPDAIASGTGKSVESQRCIDPEQQSAGSHLHALGSQSAPPPSSQSSQVTRPKGHLRKARIPRTDAAANPTKQAPLGPGER
ncbi:hypothetical protein FRB90_010763 [Tulasnella sp. 427]|nr:hypothetical protein FRB90_010763 [Tulasnella sp. 427]